MKNGKLRLKILYVGTMGIPPKYGGFETCVFETAKNMVKRGHQPIVMCAMGWKRYLSRKLPRIYKDIMLRWVPQLGNPMLDRVLREFLPLVLTIKEKFDVVHIYGPSLFNLFWKMRRKKIVISTDGFEWKRDSYSRIVSLIVYLGYLLGVKSSHVVCFY